ncbi:PAS domain-containing protein [Micromonospora sp. NBC_01699]|uniref:PAS domain-containing protein n=1 Tax=Micromonospora sp. NBC_01699 TaxID=2975984 RepID=UPI002E2D2F43|nr:PAS domain-containing protein [Micromonospora sp. NBC_01699]
MAHVELSLTEAFVSPADDTSTGHESDSFNHWSASVSRAAEPCLLIDLRTTITAISDSCCALLGLSAPAKVVGHPLLDGELRLLDFTAARGELHEQEVDKIPPLLALSSGRLTRGLLRVQAGTGPTTDATVDAISTPLLVAGAVAGSLTFFAKI